MCLWLQDNRRGISEGEQTALSSQATNCDITIHSQGLFAPIHPEERTKIFMRTRKHTVLIRMNDEELEHLNQMVGASIYNREKFLRLLLKGYTMQECPKEFNEFRTALVYLASDLRLFRWNDSLTAEEWAHLLQVSNEAWELIEKLDVIYMPYYKEAKEKGRR